MSLYLTLCPLEGPSALIKTSALCYDRLLLDQDYRIFGQLADMSSCREDGRDDIPERPTIKVHQIPPQMWVEIYEEEGIERTREDHYSTELTFVYAQQLKRLEVPNDASPKNKAIKAFVDALPDDTPIILMWH